MVPPEPRRAGVRAQQRARLPRHHRRQPAPRSTATPSTSPCSAAARDAGGREVLRRQRGSRKLVVDHAVRHFQRQPDGRQHLGRPERRVRVVRVRRAARIGGPSTRAVMLANDVAGAINALGLGAKYVGLYAYNQHLTRRPRVHPNVIPAPPPRRSSPAGLRSTRSSPAGSGRGRRWASTTTSASSTGTGTSPRATGGRPAQLAKFIPAVHAKGVLLRRPVRRRLGPYGLGHYAAARMLWTCGRRPG